MILNVVVGVDLINFFDDEVFDDWKGVDVLIDDLWIGIFELLLFF